MQIRFFIFVFLFFWLKPRFIIISISDTCTIIFRLCCLWTLRINYSRRLAKWLSLLLVTTKISPVWIMFGFLVLIIFWRSWRLPNIRIVCTVFTFFSLRCWRLNKYLIVNYSVVWYNFLIIIIK